MEGGQAASGKANVSVAQPIIRACDMCRKKKIRCEPTGDTCVQCIKYKTNCHFTPISTKRRPRNPPGQKHVEELEKRLKRMEGLLQVAMEGRRIGNVGRKEGTSFSVLDLERNQQVARARPEELQLGEHVWRKTAPTCDFPNSSLSVSSKFQTFFSAPEQSPTMIYEPMMISEKASPIWKGSLVRDVFTRRSFRELPSKSVALDLIDEAFKSFNYSFPIFEQQSFMSFVHEKYSESGPNDPGWWACINVVLALAHRFRAMRTLETQGENSEACGYMQNALAVVSELTMLHNSLPAVQALLGMTIVLQGTPNPRLCSVLIAAALRLAQTMGLHRKNCNPNLTEGEIEQRKRVFWIAYFLDKDISLRTGQPPAQDDDDMDIDWPLHTMSDLPLDGSSFSNISFFNCRIGLAIIQGQVYKRLYSAKAVQQSEAEQSVAVHELDAMLATWRNSVPIDFAEESLTTLQSPICPDVLHKIVLRFTYVNCLITIHRPFPRNDDSTAPSDDLCVNEARKAVQLIEITPRGDYACAWLLIHYFFAAVTTILHHILRNPKHTLARSDVQLVEPFLGLLELLAKEGKSDEAQHMFEFCQDLDTKAKEAVERVNMRMVCQAGKSRGEKESVEAFIQRVECISQGCPSLGVFVQTQVLEPEVASWGSYSSGFNDLDMLDQ